jgi:hypothetical protein
MASSHRTRLPAIVRLLQLAARQWRSGTSFAALYLARINQRVATVRPAHMFRPLRGFGVALRELGDARAGIATPFDRKDKPTK